MQQSSNNCSENWELQLSSLYINDTLQINHIYNDTGDADEPELHELHHSKWPDPYFTWYLNNYKKQHVSWQNRLL